MTIQIRRNRINVPKLANGTETTNSYKVIFATPLIVVSVKSQPNMHDHYLVRVEKTVDTEEVPDGYKIEKYLKKQSDVHWSCCFTGKIAFQTVIKYLANTFIEV